MAGESRENAERVLEAELPESVEQWLSEISHELGVDRGRLVTRLLTSMKSADGQGDGEELSLQDLPSRIDALEDDVDRKIEDVRDRVVQVKLEADNKAPMDHDHADIEGRIDKVATVAQRAAGQVETVRESVEDLEDRTEAGFENYEAILDDLIDATEDAEEKLDTLAAAVLDVRESVEALEDGNANGTAVTTLATTANRNGIDAAQCDKCGKAVRIALLTEPTCPHCSAAFDELEPRSGWFRSSVLTTVERPALTDDGERSDVVGEDEAADGDGERGLAVVDGLGPTAAANLRDAEVESLSQLAAAEADALAAETGLPEERIARWIAQAEDRLIDGERSP